MRNDHEIRRLTSELLSDQSLDTVTGGTPGFPGAVPLGTPINTSIWNRGPWSLWNLVGATGTVPH
jgi:hypothetical protein